ncbi:major capsid protein [Microviridae sp.]|nr:major capsid protein [Microviridae sp.]
MQSVMDHTFSEVPRADIPRSTFNRSHGLKTTFDSDWLVPILVDDVMPGDSFNVDCHHFARLGSPLIHPIMDNMYLETFFFFVPYRLLWDNWEKFMGAQEDPNDSIDYTIPKVSADTTYDLTTGSNFGNLSDYLGLPHRNSVNLSEFSALPYRAYSLIWNDWFRDQNLQDSLNVDTDDGPDNDDSDYALMKRAKRHDYFTSALPWPQKGDAVSLPLGTTAPISGLGLDSSGLGAAQAFASVYETDLGGTNSMTGWRADPAPGGAAGRGSLIVEQDTANNPGIYANLSSATAASINDLRLAFQTQRLLERDARSGTRYVEMILAHFGVTVPDFRVQRPEFLGGGSSVINTHEVPNTSATATEQQGELTAYGTSSGRHGFTKSFVEHGVVIGLANVRGDITYSQGAERYWFKETRLEFYFPVLSQIGEQAINNREIFYQNSLTDEQVFGYQERYAEYRYKPARLTGLFRPDNATSLDSWTLTENFASLPALGNTFIQSNTGAPLDRAISIPSEPQIIADFYFDMKCARPMPLYGVPGSLDHF